MRSCACFFSHRPSWQLLDDGFPLGSLRCMHLHNDMVLLWIPRFHELMRAARHDVQPGAASSAQRASAPPQERTYNSSWTDNTMVNTRVPFQHPSTRSRVVPVLVHPKLDRDRYLLQYRCGSACDVPVHDVNTCLARRRATAQGGLREHFCDHPRQTPQATRPHPPTVPAPVSVPVLRHRCRYRISVLQTSTGTHA